MNGNGEDHGNRLTRLEEFVEVLANEHVLFADEHKRLLIAQVVLTDGLDRLKNRVDELAQAQIHTEERLSILMRMKDDWVKRQS